MMWLAQHMLLWLGVSFGLGLVTAVVATVRRVSVDRWEEVPVGPEVVAPATGEAEAAETSEEPVPGSAAPESPFPMLEGADDPAPWVQQEQWSRAAKLSDRTTGGRGPSNEWEEAASNWRTWAEEAAGRDSVDSAHSGDSAGAAADDESFESDPTSRRVPDEELFARDREPPERTQPDDHDLFAADRRSEPEEHPDVARREMPEEASPLAVEEPQSDPSDGEREDRLDAEPAAVVVVPSAEAPGFEPADEPAAAPAASHPSPPDPVGPGEPRGDAGLSGGALARPFRRKRRSELMPRHDDADDAASAPAAPVAPVMAAAPWADEPAMHRAADELRAGDERQTTAGRHAKPGDDQASTPEEQQATEPEPEHQTTAGRHAGPGDEQAWAPEDQQATEPEPEREAEPGDELVVSDGVPRPYGPGSAHAPADNSIPVGYAIKGQLSTMLFYPVDAPFYSHVAADVYFDTEESAGQAGFIRFDRRSSTAHVALRPENLR